MKPREGGTCWSGVTEKQEGPDPDAAHSSHCSSHISHPNHHLHTGTPMN